MVEKQPTNNGTEGEPKNLHPSKFPTFLKQYNHSILFGLFLLVGTVALKINDGALDKYIADLVYNSTLPMGDRFFLELNQPWYFLNEYNNFFEYFLLVFFLGLILIGFIGFKKIKFFGRYGAYGLVSSLLGAGVVVNWIFKAFFGRPRPRQTNLWPNSLTAEMYDFYSVWEPAFLKDPGLIGEAKSFPSGHVSLLASFIIIFFIFQNTEFWVKKIPSGNPKTKRVIILSLQWFGLIMSVIVGILTGIGRIVAGAHHLSDVLWAFGMVYIVNAIVYHWVFRIPKFEANHLNKVHI